MNKIKAIIVDDEMHACKNLQTILHDLAADTIEVIAYTHSCADADILIEKHKPNLVFFDIEMPQQNSLDYLHSKPQINYEVVFVTAYDRYAIRALKLNALDYVLKPIDIDEFSITIQRIIGRFQQSNNQLLGADVLNKVIHDKAENAEPNTIVIKDHVEYYIVDFQDILFMEAMRSYCKVTFYLNGKIKNMIVSFTLADYEQILPVDLFYRIHKKYLINRKAIKKILHQDQYCVEMNDGSSLSISRRRFQDFSNFISHSKN